MANARDKRVERAQMRVLFQVPFFAPGVAKMPVRFDSSIQTACTNGEEIVWNPDWFDKLDDKCLPTVLCHEVAHCMLGHLWRMPSGGQWDTWNQATDHAVNLMLKEFSALVQGKRLADPFPFPEPETDYLADPSFAGQSEEQIYSTLAKRQNPPSAKGKPGSGQGKGKQSVPGPSGAHSMPEFGQMSQPSGALQDVDKQNRLKNDWEGTFIESVKIAQSRGETPAGLERLVDKLVSPAVPWYQVLRSFLREQCADDWDFLSPALEYSGSDFILPSLKSERMGAVVFATDTSGSINQELLAVFQTEKQSCLDEMRPSKLVDIYCDSIIHKVSEYEPGDTISKKAPGGGGTDFRPVFKHCEGLSPDPKCVVYLTDLDGSFPKEAPPYPVLWVTWEKDGKAPFGQVIYAGD